MGNGWSGGGGRGSSPTGRPASQRPLSCTQRTRSLPICHHDHRHVHLHGSCDPERRGGTTTAACRLRRALPNLVSNVSTTFTRKLSRSSSGRDMSEKRRSGKRNSAEGKNNQQSQFRVGGGGKGEKRARSKTREHRRLFRQMVGDWRLSDLHCLLVEFESALAVGELCRRADAARPPAAALKDDIARLYRESNCSGDGTRGCDDPSADTIVLLDGQRFAVHRAFLSRRCPFFQRRLALLHSELDGDRRPIVGISFPPSVTPLTASAFDLLLEYVYTGDLNRRRELDFHALIRFNYEHRVMASESEGRCGDGDRRWSALEDDVGAMWGGLVGGGGDADAVLTFANSQAPSSSWHGDCQHAQSERVTGPAADSDDGPPLVPATDKLCARCCQFECHSLVLAARSPFFRGIIRKRQRDRWSKQWKRGDALPELLEIVLDESVIPRQYAGVLLHTMYTDRVNLDLVTRDGVWNASSCLTEVKAIAAGKCQQSPVDQATDLYQIARFLEFDILCQGCEDIIASCLTLDNLSSVYSWAAESYGSAYVRRRCVDYLCQEFSRFCTSPLLYDTSEALLQEVLKSDYAQASELDILNAVVRWGEQQLARLLEEREPNVLAGTTHSISRKGVKRADLSDEELKDVLANLLPLVRVDYVLPPNHAVLENAVSRGLITAPLADKRPHGDPAGAGCPSSSSSSSTEEHSWTQGHWSRPHRRSAGPRLFLPYLLEARALLEKRVAECPDQLSSLINHHPPVQLVLDGHFAAQRRKASGYPDALYMVEDDPRSRTEITPLPDDALRSVQERVDCALRTSATVKRAITCGCSYHKSSVLQQVRLQVVREYGLADSTVSLLDGGGWSGPVSSTALPVGHCHWPQCASNNTSAEETVSYSDASSPAKRRFQSQPELSQRDALVTADWPDLMRSSVGASAQPRAGPWRSCQAVEQTSLVSDCWQKQLVDLTQQICDLVVSDAQDTAGQQSPTNGVNQNTTV